jgi:ABC-type multidrug transport system fused ATPase/permease subunit
LTAVGCVRSPAGSMPVDSSPAWRHPRRLHRRYRPRHARPSPATPRRLRRPASRSYSVLNKFFDVLPEMLIGVAVDVVVNQKESFMAGLGIVEPMTAAVAADRADHRHLGARIAVRVPLRAELARAGAGPAARAAPGRLRALQQLPPDAVTRARSGRLMAVMNEDVNQIERFLNTGANDLIQVFVSSLLVGAVFFVLTPTLALLAILPIPLIVVGAFWFQTRLRRVMPPRARRRRRCRRGSTTTCAAWPRSRPTPPRASRPNTCGGLGWLPREERRGDPLRRRDHAGDPHGDPARLRRHAALRRLADAAWANSASAAIRRWSTSPSACCGR